MERRTFFISAALIPLALSLGGCDDRWTDYNYKMTIYAGGKAYSTVRHVTLTEGATIQDSSGRRIDRSIEGEAVLVDTPNGPVFALMMPESGQFGFGRYATYVAGVALAPAIGEPSETEVGQATREYREQQPGYDALADDVAQHRAMLKVKGPRELPRTIPNPDRYRGPRDIPVWPKFVRFSNRRDARTMEIVSPSEIGIRRITIEITDEDVTKSIEPRLPSFREESGFKDWYQSLPSGHELQIAKNSFVAYP